MKIFYLTLMLTAFLQMSLFGQWSDNPAVNNVISSAAGEQAIPKIATCPNGDSYIGFFSNEGGNYNVRLQRLDNQGNTLWADNGILISDNEAMTWLTDWDMAADINNHCILTWQDIRNGNNNVYAYRISPDGTFVWGNDGIALSNNSEFNAAPKVVTTEAGNSVFAWSSGDVIIMQKLNAAGVKQWGDNGITLSSANTLNWPQMLPVGTDDIILKYFNDSGPPNAPTRHVFAQRYNSSGNPVWPAPATISNAGGISAWTQIFPFINDGSDGFYIAWHDDRDNNMMSSVWVHHVNSSGQIQFPANGVEASTASGFNHFYPYLACPPGSSDVFVYWNEMNGLQSQKGIFGQKFNAAGDRQWGASGMSFIPLSATSITPLAARNTPTDMIVLYDEAVSGSAAHLKAMRIAQDGSFVWPGNHVTVSSSSSSKVHTVINEFQNNQWIVAWEDNRLGNTDVFAQNLLLEGLLGAWDPTFGSIQGQVTLDGGTGNLTQVVITAGNESTYPDPTGFYFLTVPTGTYTVTATLAGYYPGSVSNVVVLEDQTTSGVDFTLQAIPTTGYIEGMVTLSGGTGNVEDAIISVGNATTNPNANGFYSIEASVGVWDVEASLDGYVSQIRSNIMVNPGETTPGIDFTLVPVSTTGYIQGYVSIAGDLYDLTEVTVVSSGVTTNPNANGFYFMELPVGNHDVTATHTYTLSQTLFNVAVQPGMSTVDVNFQLMPLRRDLICKSVDQYGGPLNGTSFVITGPEGDLSGTIVNDSVVFPDVAFGHYQGTANFGSGSASLADTIIDNQNQHLIFEFIITGTKLISKLNLTVSPNPVTNETTINLNLERQSALTFSLFDESGSLAAYSENIALPAGKSQLLLNDLFQNLKLSSGIYILQVKDEKTAGNVKLSVK